MKDLPATFTEVETLTRVNGHWLIDLALYFGIITRHNHLAHIFSALGEVNSDRNIRSPQKHLGAVVSMKSGVSATFLLGQDVEGSQELALCLGGARSDNNHTTADLFTFDTTEKETSVVTSLSGVELLLEGFEAGDDSLDGQFLVTDEFNFFALLKRTTFDTTSSDSTTSGNGENIWGISAQ